MNLTVAKAIYFAMFSFNIILPVVCYVALQGQTEKPEVPMQMIYLFGVVGVVNTVLGFTFPVIAGNAVRKSISAPHSLTPVDVYNKAFVPWLISIVLLEFVNILGFVSGFISGEFMYMIPFTVVALAAMSLKAPSESAFRKFVGLEDTL